MQWEGYQVECTLEATLYGYLPSLGANAFFAAFFAVCFVWNLFCGIRYKTWTYMVRPIQLLLIWMSTLLILHRSHCVSAARVRP